MLVPLGRSRLDAATHLLNCRMLRALESSDPSSAIYTEFFDYFQTTDTITAREETQDAPRIVVIQGSEMAMIMMGGVHNAPLAGRFRTDYDPILGSFNSDQGPQIFKRAADVAFSMMTSGGLLACRQMMLLGYSFGGGCMDELTINFASGHIRPRIESWDYGSPRNTDSRRMGAYTQNDRTRSYLANDPVVRFPSRITEAPVMAAAVGLPTALVWNGQLHPVNGFRWDIAGNVTITADDSAPIATIDLRFTDWLLGSNLIDNPEHAIQTYVDRFTSFLGRQQFVPPVDPPIMPVLRPVVITTGEGRAQFGAAVHQAAQIYATDRDQLLRLAQNTLPRGASGRLRRRRIHGGYAILLDDQVLAIAPNRRSAKAEQKAIKALLQ